MTNRRRFLGAVLAATAAGGVRLANGGERASPLVGFYARRLGAKAPASGLFDGKDFALGSPEGVERGSVTIGHFHALVHDGAGKVSYIYEATLADSRSGYVKLCEAATCASI
jgi:hypothetical protein